MLPFIFLVVGVLAQQTFAEEPEAIVGGTSASPGEFPHQISLRYDGSHICGGSIISSTKILTAAHCVDGMDYKKFKVATGSTVIDGGKLYDVESVREHPQYSDRAEDAWKNDVAVITLRDPIQFNAYQSPIALADTETTAGQVCTLSGWGRISTNGPLPRTLQKMEQIVMSRNECQRRNDMPLTSSHLCAYNRYGIGACSGDSGGPLVITDNKGNRKQIGITSWVLPCAKGEPDVYTDVFTHLFFIRSS